MSDWLIFSTLSVNVVYSDSAAIHTIISFCHLLLIEGCNFHVSNLEI